MPPEPSPALRQLVARLPSFAIDDYGIGAAGQRFAVEVQKQGSEAIPLLLPYLKHPRQNVRDLAGYTLRNIKGLNASHLDALIEAERKESTWLTPAIARIGTPRAVAFLGELLRERDWTASQIDFAFQVLDVKGIPVLCRELSRTAPGQDNVRSNLLHILGQLSDAAKRSATTPFAAIALNNSVNLMSRRTAVEALGELGAAGREAIPALRYLARQKPAEFQQYVDRAVVDMNGPEAVVILVRWLHDPSKSPELVMRNVGKLQKNGKAACLEVVRWLDSTDWNARMTAAQALGFIGCPSAASLLVPLLENQEDWRLVWTASEALGRLGFQPAREALARVARSHWYPSVREVAAVALRHLDKRVSYPTLSEKEYTYETMSSFDRAFEAYRQFRKDYRNPPLDYARKELAVAGGKLVGTDGGEWGGALTFVSERASAKRLLDKNVQAVTQLGPHIVAVTGLGHLSLNEGDLFRVVRDKDGDWSAVRWRVLPGAPQWVQAREDAAGPFLRVTCLGGVVDVAPDGVMRWVAP